MLALIRYYPPVYYQLMLLFFLQQFSYYSYLFAVLEGVPLYGEQLVAMDPPAYRYFHLSVGLAFLLAGWLYDRIPKVRLSLFWGISLMLFGHMLGLLGMPVLLLPSCALVNLGGALFSIACYMHVGILFSTASGYKDAAFIGMAAVYTIALMAAVLLIPILMTESPAFPILINLAIYIGLIFFVMLYKDIGYQIEEDEEEEPKEAEELEGEAEEDNSWSKTQLLLLVIVGMTLLELISIYSPFIGVSTTFAFVGLAHWLWPLSLFLLVMGFLVLFFIAGDKSRQLEKIQFCLYAFLVIIGMEWLIRLTPSYEMDYIADFLPNLLLSAILFPVATSIITHINYEYNPGMWLGLFFALGELGYFVMDVLIWAGLISHTIVGILISLLTVLLLIGFLENKAYLATVLALDVPNRTEAPEEDNKDDILEHLIE